MHIDRSNVKVLGEVKHLLIKLTSNHKNYQIIDIVVVDIHEMYGLLLSRDWSKNLNGKFSTNWSHLWIPLNNKPNKIKIEREKHVKYIVTDLGNQNEPIMFTQASVNNYSFDSYLGNFAFEESSLEESDTESLEFLTLVVFYSNQVSSSSINDVNTDFWML